MGYWLQLDELHLVTTMVATATVVLLVNVVTGQLSWRVENNSALIQALCSGSTAWTLALTAANILMMANRLQQYSVARPHGAYERLSGIIASLALVILFWLGLGVEGDPEHVSLMCLALETSAAWDGQLFGTPALGGSSRPSIAPASIALVSVVLIGLCIASVAAACVPGRDPFGWNEKQRERYIYGAELLGAVLVWHLRLTVPHWFDGFLQRYWTLLTLALAYLGVGMSEYFRRTKQTVLIHPLQRTGVLLAIVPLAGIRYRPRFFVVVMRQPGW